MSPPIPHYAEPSLYPIQGGCSCGLIRYQLSKPPMYVHCCHCTSCQRETGSAFGLNAFIEADLLEKLPPTTATVPDSISSYSRDDKEDDNKSPALPVLPEWTGPKSPAKIVDPVLFTTPTQSGAGQRMARCPRCMICVWSHYDVGVGDLLPAVRVGTLDKAFLVEPDVHIFTKSMRKGVESMVSGSGKPVFEEFYPLRDFYRDDAMERFGAMVVKWKENKSKAMKEEDKSRI